MRQKSVKGPGRLNARTHVVERSSRGKRRRKDRFRTYESDKEKALDQQNTKKRRD